VLQSGRGQGKKDEEEKDGREGHRGRVERRDGEEMSIMPAHIIVGQACC